MMTLRGHGEQISASPALRFTLGGMVAFLTLAVLGMFLNTTGALKLTQFSLTGYGYEVLAVYGFFSMCAYGGIYFIVPRITRRRVALPPVHQLALLAHPLRSGCGGGLLGPRRALPGPGSGSLPECLDGRCHEGIRL